MTASHPDERVREPSLDARPAPGEQAMPRTATQPDGLGGPPGRPPSFLQPSSLSARRNSRSSGTGFGGRLSHLAAEHLNFYRVHVLLFVTVPLIISGIFYAANGENKIAYIDCLFVCVSAATVTGLATINVSTLTGFQQALLFILMCVGNITAVSVTMVWIRRHFFRKKFDHLVRNDPKMRRKAREVQKRLWAQRQLGVKRVQALLQKGKNGEQKEESHELDMEAAGGGRARTSEKGAKYQQREDGHPRDDASARSGASSTSLAREKEEQQRKEREKKKNAKKRGRVTASMIRRADEPAVLMNPSVIPDGGAPPLMNNAGTSAGGPGILSNPLPPSEGGPTYTGLGNGAENPPSPLAQMVSRDREMPSVRIAMPHASPTPAANHRSSVAVTDDSAENGDGNESADGEMSYLKAFRRSAARAARLGRTDADGEPTVIDNEDEQPAATGTPRGFRAGHARRGSEGAALPPLSSSAAGRQDPFPRAQTIGFEKDPFPRAQTIGFAEPATTQHTHHRATAGPGLGAYASGYSSMPTSATMRSRTGGDGPGFERTATRMSGTTMRRTRTYGSSGLVLARTMTQSKNTGFGGFPTPIDFLHYLINKLMSSRAQQQMPRTSTIASTHSLSGLSNDPNVRSAPYFSFDVLVSRNSKFHELTEEQRDELGGVEYRAIDLLAKIIPAYWFIVNFFFITLVAPYASSRVFNDRYGDAFSSQGQYAPNRVWWVFFNTVSAYSNTGLSLLDTSVTLLQDAYLVLIPIMLLILLGNTGFPIALRCFIWILSKVTPSRSRMHESLQFLLDHPRRCFVYLFPAAQTWFLLFMLVVLK